RVFSEGVDRQRRLRLLCMQYVPGTTLEQVLRALRHLPPDQWSGRGLVEAIDRCHPDAVPLDRVALRDREFLAAADFVEAGCWWGACLAEALDHAHGRGVLHRNIKPANILVTPYGKLLLADFGLAHDGRRTAGGPFGGTLPYMASEHLDAFNPEDPTAAEAV